MARFRKPFFKKSHKAWYVQIDGRQIRLDSDEEIAFERYHELMREKRRIERFTPSGPKRFTLGTLFQEFVTSAFTERSKRTKDFYCEKLTPLIAHLGNNFFADDLKPFHVEQYIALHPNWKKGTIRTVWQAIQRLMRWGHKSGRIGHTLVCDYKKPGPTRRTTIITPETYERIILPNITSEPFRHLVTVAWETGARPQEFLKTEARHYDATGKRLVLPIEEAKGEQWPRIIYLTEVADKIVCRLIAQYPAGRIFRNQSHRPWTTSSVNCEWIRLRHKLGFAKMKEIDLAPTEEEIRKKMQTLSKTKRNGREKTEGELREEARLKVKRAIASKLAPKFCLYHFRHSFLDRKLKAGVDALTCAILLGHRDPSTLAKVYQHLSQSPDYLRKALEKQQ